jgi:hypothetical protein
MKAASFEEALELGNMGERLVVALLQSRGCGVIPSYDFSGKHGEKAPRLTFKGFGLVIPDLDVCKTGTRKWLEVKTYRGPADNRRYKTKVHGIPKRLADDYAAVEAQTATPIYIAVLELDSGELLVARQSILTIWPCQCRGCAGAAGWCGAPIKRGVYWPRDNDPSADPPRRGMSLLHRFSDDELRPIRDRWPRLAA